MGSLPDNISSNRLRIQSSAADAMARGIGMMYSKMVLKVADRSSGGGEWARFSITYSNACLELLTPVKQVQVVDVSG